MIKEKIKIFNLSINKANYTGLLACIEDAIASKTKLLITYVTANTLNTIYNDKQLPEIFNYFNIVHPDGIGTYLASKFLFGKNGLEDRITGSDFYPILIKTAIEKEWSLFFFGDTDKTLSMIKEKNNGLIIKETQNGFSYNKDEVIQKINYTKPDILVVGLGQPKQEKWIYTNKDLINCNVILAVGDGIKVFAGIKQRGAKFFQFFGLEWLIRLFYNPLKFWKRYLIGIPLFSMRILKTKTGKII
jgi:N-acetylglucosaminyldiphosphoundecaprenol N-acetyl-beta-D-mannosaminyltransferase